VDQPQDKYLSQQFVWKELLLHLSEQMKLLAQDQLSRQLVRI
jgi:hypothetical protein